MYRVWFRPRILRDVSTVNWSTTILGQKSSLPVYIVRHAIENFQSRIAEMKRSLQLRSANLDIPMENSI